MEQPEQPIPIIEQPPKPPIAKKVLKIGVFVIIVILLGCWVGFWVNKTTKIVKPTASPAQLTPTIQPTPVNRQESTIASQSAFLTVQQSVASLSASLSTLSVSNTLLNPPAIELPLGFDNK